LKFHMRSDSSFRSHCSVNIAAANTEKPSRAPFSLFAWALGDLQGSSQLRMDFVVIHLIPC
jgi:hypothetical protein